MMQHPLNDVLPKWARPAVPMVTNLGAVLLFGCVASSGAVAQAEEGRGAGSATGPKSANLPLLLVVGAPAVGTTLAVAIPTDRDLWMLIGLLLASAVAAICFLASHHRRVQQQSRRDPQPQDKRRRPEV